MIHIFEDEWLYKKDIIKLILLNIINPTINEVIYKTDYIIKNVNKVDSSSFLNKHHINGDCKSSIKLGLYYNNELISVMLFMNKHNNIYELTRFATSKSSNWIFIELFNFFIKTYNPERIISFGDRRFINNIDNLYINSGFKFLLNTPPKCYYINQKNYQVRYNSLLNINKGDKYDRIWDCGKTKYDLKLF